MTNALVAVAAAIMARPNDRHWGYELTKETGHRSGAIYPLLTKLLAQGWLADGWETEADTGGDRPPRRYYTLTDDGRRELGAVVARAGNEPRFRGIAGLGWAT